MAEWTGITNPQVAAGAAITTALMTALRDNVVAVAEGADGAPTVRLDLNGIPLLTAGTSIRSRVDAQASTGTGTGGASVEVTDFAFLQAGTVRCSGQHRTTNSSMESRLEFVRSRAGVSSVVATWTTTSTSFQARTADIDVLPGDTIRARHVRVGAGGANGASISANVRMSVSDDDVYWPVSSAEFNASVEGNPT